MKSFGDYNPIAVFLFYAGVTITVMFSMDPVLLALSLAGSLAVYALVLGKAGRRGFWFYLVLPVILGLGNPLFNHNGVTVLLIINNNPITLESMCYGFAMGVMLTSVMLWFRSFSEIMTSDKLLYLFGSVSPKLALILSMTLRYIPLFRTQIRKTQQAQKALGLYKEDSIPDNIRGGIRIFSVMVSWALENGVITADSMTARGYGTKRRSRFAIFRFRREDGVLLAVSVLLAALTLTASGMGAMNFEWYPAIRGAGPSVMRWVGYISYGALCVLPLILEGKEALRWKSLQSAI